VQGNKEQRDLYERYGAFKLHYLATLHREEMDATTIKLGYNGIAVINNFWQPIVAQATETLQLKYSEKSDITFIMSFYINTLYIFTHEVLKK